MKLELESTIGNFDQKFVDEWYLKVKRFSLILIKDITAYCRKTIKSTNESIKNTDATLRNLREKQEFLNIDKVLKKMQKLPNVSCNNGNSKSSTI